MIKLILALGLISLSVSASTQTEISKRLSILSGCWEGNVGGAVVEERWDKLGGNMMLGTAKTVANNAVQEWEFIHIRVSDKEVLYTPFINGVEMKPFFLIESRAGIVFENKQNAFPKQIIYVNSKEGLKISLKGDEATPSVEYVLKPVSCVK